ncbi:MAG: glycosyltransferase family 4 protein [Leptodesmis sp.]|uniref:glycosyltransferase family 4 protein n=1 Tax=Leptodesmis sp. TaxID=3100501 RepID=UPI003D130E36
MRITFVTPEFNLSGGMRIIAMYANRLQQRGHQVTVVAAAINKPSLVRQTKSVLKGQGLISPPVKQPSHFDGVKFECRSLDRFGPVTDADVPDADVVIATWWETAEWVAKLSTSKGAKAYLIQHYEIFDYLPKERVKRTWSLPMHKIVIAQWLADIAAQEYSDHHVSCVPNGIDTQQFHALPRGKQSVPTIGMMYAEPYWKGCDLSLKAFSLAAEQIPGLRLVAFGHCPPLAHLPLPPETEYIQCPPQARMKDIYSNCDAWLFGSRFEGFGLPILEAMACRTPVIGTPAGAAPELLAKGGGLLVPSEDPEAMAAAIVKVCRSSEAEWRAMSHQAHATALQHSWGETTELFEAALHTAIQRSHDLRLQIQPQRKFMNLNLRWAS